MAAAQALFWRERREPGFVRSFMLAAAMHAALIGVMFLGVRWQIHQPDVIQVELWEPRPAPPKVEPVPPRPAPPKLEPPKPEPRLEKPDIAVKEKAKPPPKPKVEPKKAEPKRDLEFEKRLRDQVAMEQKTLDQQRQERELRDLLAKQQSAARDKALGAWIGRIQAKIRGNLVLPPDLKGNPEAIFDVALLPTGEVLSYRLRKSSGHARYDAAIERAIQKSSPLPKPDEPGLFRRDLELKFRPLDQ